MKTVIPFFLSSEGTHPSVPPTDLNQIPNRTHTGRFLARWLVGTTIYMLDRLARDASSDSDSNKPIHANPAEQRRHVYLNHRAGNQSDDVTCVLFITGSSTNELTADKPQRSNPWCTTSTSYEVRSSGFC